MFSIAPLSCLKPVYVRIDNLGLQMLNNGKKIPYLHLLNEKANKICKSKEIGRNLQTDGTQAIIQYIEVVTLKLRGDKKKQMNGMKRRHQDGVNLGNGKLMGRQKAKVGRVSQH